MASETHDPHVIKKERDGGSRHGEVTYYAVGWQRTTRSAAREDLELFLGADGQAGQVAALRVALKEADRLLDCLRRLTTPEEAWRFLTINDGDDVAATHEAVRAALAPGAGKREGAVLRAAADLLDESMVVTDRHDYIGLLKQTGWGGLARKLVARLTSVDALGGGEGGCAPSEARYSRSPCSPEGARSPRRPSCRRATAPTLPRAARARPCRGRG
jgi:hypothetical protein